MLRIQNKIFKNYFLENHLKTSGVTFEDFYECLNALTRFRQKSYMNAVPNKELKYVGTAIFDLENEINVKINSFSFKIVDLLSGIISSINSESYSSALTITRSLLEHFAMINLKFNNYLKFLEEKNYEKLSIELAYWGVDYKLNNILTEEAGKRTHVYKALRFFSKYISKKNDVKYSEEDILKEYDEFSEMIHPASNSLMMYYDFSIEHTEDDDGSIGIGQKFIFSNNSDRIQKRVFNIIAWPLLFITLNLSNDIYPNLLLKVAQKIFNDRNEIIKYFKENPKQLEELKKRIINQEELEKYYKDLRNKHN